jgi:hypothetical protein
VANGHNRRSPRRRSPAAGRGLTQQEDGQQVYSFGSRPRLRGGSLMTIRGGGDTTPPMALMPAEECAHCLGAPLLKRMAASWSGSQAGPTEYKVAARGSRALAGSPRFVVQLPPHVMSSRRWTITSATGTDSPGSACR